MTDWLTLMRLLSDPTRLRLMAVLQGDSLSVAELQEVLNMGQSRISTHLGLLKTGGLLTDRREGKKIFYQRSDGITPAIDRLIQESVRHADLAQERTRDQENLKSILERRRIESMNYFNALAGRAGRKYCPGRSWVSLAQMFLEIPPDAVVADLGAGEGYVAQLMARSARQVVAVDLSPRMVDYAQKEAGKAGLKNIEFREGDIEAPPVEAGSVDVAVFSQALHHAANPSVAIAAAWRMLKPGGRLVILDLKQHHFDAARELYSDVWLGFSETELTRWMKKAGFRDISVRVVEREGQPPHFQTVLARARKAG